MILRSFLYIIFSMQDKLLELIQEYCESHWIQYSHDIKYLWWSRNSCFQIWHLLFKVSERNESLKKEYSNLILLKNKNYIPKVIQIGEIQNHTILIYEFVKWMPLDQIRVGLTSNKKKIIIDKILTIIFDIHRNLSIQQINDLDKLSEICIDALKNPFLTPKIREEIWNFNNNIRTYCWWDVWILHNDIWWKNIVLADDHIYLLDRELGNFWFLWFEYVNLKTSQRYSEIEEDKVESNFWEFFFSGLTERFWRIDKAYKHFYFIRRLRMLKNYSSRSYDHAEALKYAMDFKLL